MVNDVSQDRLRQLAAHRDGGAVLSLFLGLDPSEVPTAPARQSAVDALMGEAKRAVEDASLPHEARVRLREALGEVKARLDVTAAAEGARGVAVFAPGPQETVELLRLPTPIPTQAVVDIIAHVEPLVRLADRARWCVALVDRSRASFHVGNEDGMPLSGSLDDDVHSQHSQGGWSQARYQRSVDNEVTAHLDQVADALLTALRDGRFDRLVLAGQLPIRSELESRLDRRVKERLHGWVDLDLSAADAEAVRAAAEPVIVKARRAHEREVLERLHQGVSTPGGHGVGGLRTTLGALSERRVETLVVDPTLASPGSRCPQCGLLGLHLAECPADGTPMDQLDSIVEAAVALAYEQAAEVLLPAPAPELAAVDGIGAVTRF